MHYVIIRGCGHSRRTPSKSVRFFDKYISNEKGLDFYFVVHSDDFVHNPQFQILTLLVQSKEICWEEHRQCLPLYYVFILDLLGKVYEQV